MNTSQGESENSSPSPTHSESTVENDQEEDLFISGAQCDSRTSSNQVVTFFGDTSVDSTVDQHFTRALSHWPKLPSPTHSEFSAENNQGEKDVLNACSSSVSPIVQSSPEPSDQLSRLPQPQVSQNPETPAPLPPYSSLDFPSAHCPIQPQHADPNPQPWSNSQPQLCLPHSSMLVPCSLDIQPPPSTWKQLSSVPADREVTSKQRKLRLSRSHVKGPQLGPYTVRQPSYNISPLTHLPPSLHCAPVPLIPSYPTIYPNLTGPTTAMVRHRLKHYSSIAPRPAWASESSFNSSQLHHSQMLRPRMLLPPSPLPELSSLADKNEAKLVYPEFVNYLVQPEVDTFEDIPRVFGESKSKELASHLPPPLALLSDTTAPYWCMLNLSGAPYYDCLSRESSACSDLTPVPFTLQQSCPMYGPRDSLPMAQDSGSSCDSTSQD